MAHPRRPAGCRRGQPLARGVGRVYPVQMPFTRRLVHQRTVAWRLAAAAFALAIAGGAAACAQLPASRTVPQRQSQSQAQSTDQSGAQSGLGPDGQSGAQSAADGGAESGSDTDPESGAFDKSAHSLDDPSSIWVVANKARPVNPIEYEPADLTVPRGVQNESSQPLREPAARAAEQMFADAAAEGHNIWIISAYRSYGTQRDLYSSYVSRSGSQAADTYSSRPGHSEHQLGLAIDIDDFGNCYLKQCFRETAAGQWLHDNAPRYGFILRYPESKQDVTGFTPEPWHFRYVGPELAQEMQRQGVETMEEFFDLPAAPGYL